MDVSQQKSIFQDKGPLLGTKVHIWGQKGTKVYVQGQTSTFRDKSPYRDKGPRFKEISWCLRAKVDMWRQKLAFEDRNLLLGGKVQVWGLKWTFRNKSGLWGQNSTFQDKSFWKNIQIWDQKYMFEDKGLTFRDRSPRFRTNVSEAVPRSPKGSFIDPTSKFLYFILHMYVFNQTNQHSPLTSRLVQSVICHLSPN